MRSVGFMFGVFPTVVVAFGVPAHFSRDACVGTPGCCGGTS